MNMYCNPLRSWMGLAFGLLSAAAHAQGTAQPLWEVGLFGGAITTPAYPGSTDRASRALVLPFLVYRGEVLRADRGGIGARVVHINDFEIDIGFAGSLPANSSDVAARKDMPDLGTLIEFGPRVKGVLLHPSANAVVRFEVPLRTVLEFNNGVRGQGFALEPEVIYEMRDVASGWRLSTSASLVIGDSRLNQYFYGVPSAFATAQRPVYDAQAGLIATRLTASASKSLSPEVRLFGFVRFDSYEGAANRTSPLHLQSNGVSAGLGLTWTLGRSEAFAKN